MQCEKKGCKEYAELWEVVGTKVYLCSSCSTDWNRQNRERVEQMSLLNVEYWIAQIRYEKLPWWIPGHWHRRAVRNLARQQTVHRMNVSIAICDWLEKEKL